MATSTIAPPDSPEARKYNRIRRWLGVGEFALGLVLLLVLLVTGWTGWIRDIAYRSQSYALAVFLYTLMLIVISKLLGLGLDYYSFRLEHLYRLSNQKLRGWIWDEVKGLLVSTILAGLLVELLYFIIRQYPEHWWVLAWLGFLGVAILLAQLAPVILFPIFYKFEPLRDDDLKSRLVRLGERAGTRVRGVYKWHLSEKSKKANAALTGLGNTRRIILADTLLDNYSPDEIEAVLAHELGHHVHKHILKSIGVQAGVTFRNEGLVYRATLPDASRRGRRDPSPLLSYGPWPRSTELLPGGPERFDYVTRKLAITYSATRAQLLWELNRYQAAFPWFEDAARVGFDFSGARMNLAVAAAALGKQDVTLGELLAALRLAPYDPEPSARLAVLFAVAGRYRDAAFYFERAYKIQPSVELATNAARAWSLAGERARAQTWEGRR